MKWRKRHTVGIFLLLIGVGFYAYFVHRTHTTTTANGWTLEFSYQPFHCRVCLGRVESLTFEGKEIRIPEWDWKSDTVGHPWVQLITPTGCFCAYEMSEHWRLAHQSCEYEQSDDAISEAELARGWYNAAFTPDDGYRVYYYHNIRKRNTPDTWCLVATENTSRWLRPDLIVQLDW